MRLCRQAATFGRNRRKNWVSMFLPYQPSEQHIRSVLAGVAKKPFSYAPVGVTRNASEFDLRGFKRDATHVVLGTGVQTFEAARAALQEWRQLNLGWVRVHPVDAPLEADQTIIVVACTLGIWSLNPARVLDVIDEPQRFSFAYGTLPGHAAAGEERFTISLDERSGEVTYDILAYSRPDHWLAKLAYFYMRKQQRRFAPDSIVAMRNAINTPARTLQSPAAVSR